MGERIEWTSEDGKKRVFELRFKNVPEFNPLPIDHMIVYGETPEFVPTTTEYGYSPEIEKYFVTTITHHPSGDVRVTTHHDKVEYDQICRKALGL